MMSTFAILILLPYLILVLFFYRGFIDGYIGYALNRSSEKKRKKDTTLLDRLFFRRFRDVIPKSILYPYYFFLLIYPVVSIICLVFYLVVPEQGVELAESLSRMLLKINVIYFIAIDILFWQAEPGWKYERWYKRIKRNERRKK